MPTLVDKSDSVPTRLGFENRPVPRVLLIAHRVVVVVVLFLIVFAALTAVTAAIFGGHSLATRLMFLWHHLDSIWT